VSNDVKTYDLIIVGAGSGNLIPVPEMDQWSLAIVEPDKFGGTCLNRGCIPSKMLLYPAEVAEIARHGAKLGVHHTLDRVDWQRIVGRVWQKIDPIAKAGADYRKSQPHVAVYDKPARFVAERILETGGQLITADRIVLAAGSRPVVPALSGLDSVPYHTVDRGWALIKNEDEDVARRYTALYQQRFDVLLHAQAQRVSSAEHGVTVTFEIEGKPHTVTAEVLLFASGRRPNSDRLNVAATGIEVDERGRVPINEYLETSIPGIYAFGDLASPYQLKHIANAEARTISRQLVTGKREPVAYDGGPHAIFGHPQVASVGLTERQARQQGLRYITATRKYIDTAYGWATEDDGSFVKLVADLDTRCLLGAHILGPHASLLIQPLVQGMKYGQTVDEMARVVYIHPALTEVVEQALLEF
jgi:mycothione reductase